MSGELQAWWTFLCVVATTNAIMWALSARLLSQRQGHWPANSYATRRLILWLSAGYVIGCGFRSVLPMIEVTRICLHDLWISRVVITRSIATIAELCFAIQWALVLHEAGLNVGSRIVVIVSRLLVPIIIVAELFCWAAVLRADYLSHALENAHWTLAAVLGLVALIVLWPRIVKAQRYILAGAIVCSMGYVIFMITIDVPMYLARWEAAISSGQELRPLLDGIHLALQRCLIQQDWILWREDAVWLTLYFTIAVWISIVLPHSPLLRMCRNGNA